MHKLTQFAAATLAVMVLAPINQPEAATYAFNATNFGPSAFAGSLNTFPALSISIEDGAVESGSFSATYAGSPANFQGDYASLISFKLGSAITVTATTGDPSTFRANLLFNTDGSINAGAIFYIGDNFEIDLAGFDGFFQGAFSPTNTGDEGFVSGTFTAVPEPSCIVLLTAGVFGLGLYRRHAR